MRTRYSARRHIGAAFVVATAAVAIPFIAAAPAQAAPVTIHSEGSAVVESYPSDKVIEVDQFDDNGGLLELTEVKVIASVNGALDGSVQNLSASQAKVLTGSIEASLTVNGIGVTDLAATGQNATVWNLAPGETQPLGLAGSDSSDTTITDPAVLDQFVGVGTINYEVHSEVAVDINGPAPYKTTGVAGGEAKVRVEYTYNDTCVDNPNDPICVTDPDCATDPVTVTPVANGDYAIPGGGTFTISNYAEGVDGWTFDWSVVDATVDSITVKGGDPVGSVVTLVNGLLSGLGLHAPEDTNTGTYLEPTSVVVCAASSVTPPPCVTGFKIDPVNVGDYPLPNGGIFTIVNKVDGPDGETFDWTSTAPVQWISVKGGPNSIPEEIFDYQPAGSLGDTLLHAPLNDDGSGKWYGLSHLTICADPPPTPTCATDPTLCPPDPTCATDPTLCPPDPTCATDPTLCPPVVTCQDDWYKVTTTLNGGSDANGNGTYPLPGGGSFTIDNLTDTPDGAIFDWTSTTPILGLSVKGGPVSFDDEQKYDYPGGATSGQDVHAPVNPKNGTWYGLSHLSVCLAPTPAPVPRPAPAPKQDPDKADASDQPPAKIEKATVPKKTEVDAPDPEPKPEPTPEPKPEPQPEPQAEPAPAPPPPPAPAPAPAPAPDQAAGDAPAAQ